MNDNSRIQGLPVPPPSRDRQLPNPAYEPQLPRTTGDGGPALSPISYDKEADPETTLKETRAEMNYVLRKALRALEKRIGLSNTPPGSISYSIKIMSEALPMLRKGAVHSAASEIEPFDPAEFEAEEAGDGKEVGGD